MKECPFCSPQIYSDDRSEVALENELCLFISGPQPVLNGSGMIIPRAHRETVFDLTAEEWAATYSLLHEVKALIDSVFKPDGYNVGWNCGSVGGQTVFHAHLHVIPRFADEPRAGRGIRWWLEHSTSSTYPYPIDSPIRIVYTYAASNADCTICCASDWI